MREDGEGDTGGRPPLHATWVPAGAKENSSLQISREVGSTWFLKDQTTLHTIATFRVIDHVIDFEGVPHLQGGFFNCSPINLAKSQSLYKIPYCNFFSPILLQGGFFDWSPQKSLSVENT